MEQLGYIIVKKLAEKLGNHDAARLQRENYLRMWKKILNSRGFGRITLRLRRNLTLFFLLKIGTLIDIIKAKSKTFYQEFIFDRLETRVMLTSWAFQYQ